MAKKKITPRARPASVRFSLFQGVVATVAILAVFFLINAVSWQFEETALPFTILAFGLVLVLVLFFALQRPGWFSSLKRHPRVAAYLLMQAVLVIFFALEFLQVLQADFESRTFSFSPEPMPYVFMGLIVLALVLINFALKKKKAFTYEIQNDAKFIVKETAKIKLKRSRENPYSIAFFVYEIIYVVIIAYAISYYFNPAEELIPWGSIEQSLGIPVEPPLTTLFHIVGFIVLTALLFLFHGYVKQFDSLKFQGRKGIKKVREKKKK